MVKKQRDFLRLRHAKQYDEGSRKNPFFFKAPPRRWLIGIASTLIFLGLFTGIIALSYAPWFRIQSVEIVGATTLSTNDLKTFFSQTLEAHHRPLLAHDNAYLVQRNVIEDAYIDHFGLEYASVTQSGKHFTVTIKERVMNITLRNKEKTVFLNLDGSYLRDATTEESRAIDIRLDPSIAQPDETIIALQPDMPIILNNGNDAATSLPKTSTEHILDFQKALQIRSIHVKTFSIEGSTALWTRIQSDQPYDLLCDLEKDVEKQMSALQTLLSTPGFVTPTEYIDLRFGAYVYMK